MNWQLFGAYIAFTIVLVLIPGPIVTLVIATSASRGLRAGLITVAGTSSGNAALVATIALGLTWILQHALTWFDLLRWIGAFYLIWLGIQSWRGAGQSAPPPLDDRVHFGRGFLVALFNPKAIAFFSAFLPQFVDPALPVGPQLAAMCAVSVALGVLGDSTWAILTALGRAWLLKPSRTRLLGRLSGVTLIGGGIWLSLTRRPA